MTQRPKVSKSKVRNAAIEEVASQYHDALADFYKQQGDEEPLPGVAEGWHAKAALHRTYAREIRKQVWLEPVRSKIEGGQA